MNLLAFLKQVRPANGRRMLLIERFRKARFLAAFLIFSFAFQLVFPAVAFALTSGPASPDFSSFEPIATTNMVNEFTGQFVYNIPVLEIPGASGGGYSLSLSYHSGDGPESEASWVGYGWSLNPGSISRSKRGLPDDFKDREVKYYNEVPKNWTVAGTLQSGAQIFSGILGVSAYNTVRYNNYKGFGFTQGFGLSALKGLFSLGYAFSEGDGTFSVAVNPAAILSLANNASKKNQKSAGVTASNTSKEVKAEGVGQSMRRSSSSYISGGLGSASSSYINYLLTDMTSPYNLTPYTGRSVSGSVSFSLDPPPAPIGFDIGLNISYSEQKNMAERNVRSFGYMYSANAPDNNTSDAEAVMDYTVENASTFNKRDKYLPIPFSTPDAFFVSGEGLGGSFRMYNDKVGLFSPNYVQGKTDIDFFGFNLHGGLNWGIGGEMILPSGWHETTVKSSWTDDNGNTGDVAFSRYDNTSNDVSEPSFFRFNNDLGGKLVYDASADANKPVAAVINGNTPTITAAMRTLKEDGTVPGTHRRNSRASYVGYHTNKEMKKNTSNNKRGTSYEQRETIHTLAGRNLPNSNNSILDDEIGEVSVYNEDGNNYVYGLPVYTAEDKNIQRGLKNVDVANSNNYWVKADFADNKRVGEEYITPYPTSYLLTQITTPDYVDVNLDGPDDDDFGGYTKFSYDRTNGADDKTDLSRWYRWRTPYRGTFYNPGRLSDNTDNMGYYQSGRKEVYYLKEIETKTHRAEFVLESREDGFEALDDATASNSAMGNTGTYAMRKLDRINLYAKSTQLGQPDKLIKTIRFEYNYECWPNSENAKALGTNNNKAKLTLKRVWFEYNGVISARISPYQFEYKYPNVNYPAKYANIKNYASSVNLFETPDYTKYLDCWGNYMYQGQSRRNNLQPWPSQKPAANFDPAAWQLKRIVLPSGGEIHVQYEQHTYSRVQDRPASAMIKLAQSGHTSNKFYLNLAEMDIQVGDYSRLVALIKDTYITKGRKIYFKFFYSLLGNSPANVGDCNGDYIDGHATVNAVGYDGNGVYVQIQGTTPQQICIDYIQQQVGGKIIDGNCNSSGTMNDPASGGNLVGALRALAPQLINAVMTHLAPNQTSCLTFNPDVSYLRVPIWNKKGGGIRVKRLLMYDKGITDPIGGADDPGLYGTEYIYDNEVTRESYGVATNEPPDNNEENPLVTFLEKRESQSDWDRLIAGRDREQFEGPLGLNALPAASIGYSRIIKKNIHQNKWTGGGYSVLEYYTVKDYPYDRYYPELDANGVAFTDVQTETDDWDLDIGLFSYTINTGIRSSQGYCFIQNQMHGQLKSVADYPGEYSAAKFNSVTNPPSPVAQTSYEYFEPGSNIPMYNYNGYSIYYDQPGKEMDVTMDRRSVTDESSETRITGDVTVGFAAYITIFYPIAFPLTSGARQCMNTMSVSKVIHYPTIVKRISVMKDGYIQHTENTAFDPLSCKPVLTRTYDGHHGLHVAGSNQALNGMYTTYNVPASSQYATMGQKAWNEKFAYHASPAIYPSYNGTTGEYTFSGVNSSGAFHVGDMIAAHGTGVSIGHITNLQGSNIIVKPSYRYNTSISAGATSKIEVVRSGYTNQLSSSMGGFTEYGVPPTKTVQEFIARLSQILTLIAQSGTPGSWGIDMSDYNFTMSYLEFDRPPCNLGNVVLKVEVTYSQGQVLLRYYTVNSGSNPVPTAGINITSRLTLFAGGIPSLPDGIMFTGGSNMLVIRDHHKNPVDFDMKANLCPMVKKNVIKASMTNYKHDWAVPSNVILPAAYTNFNDYEASRRGMWRPYQTYAFRDVTRPGSDVVGGQRNYKMAGTTTMYLLPWLQVNTFQPDLWIKTNEVKKYIPNGNAVEELDANGVFSSAKYGYKGILPYVIAQNAEYSAIRFESFENTYVNGGQTTVEDGISIGNVSNLTNQAHTGYNACRLSSSLSQLQINNVGPATKGHVIKFWVDANTLPSPVTVTTSTALNLPVKLVAQAGRWYLYEAYHTLPVATSINYYINWQGTNLNIDDIRVQPAESQMTAYVYDTRSYKVSATLDDQNFATFYQYNGEGKLVRKKLETLKGVMTTEEAQYHTPLIQRN